jgi:Domain of unknown function (DUF4112)
MVSVYDYNWGFVAMTNAFAPDWVTSWRGDAPGIGCTDMAEAIKRMDGLSGMLDSAYQVPGTRIRFGVDAILGLVPGVGDLASTALSSYVVFEAHRLGVPRRALAQMLGNLAIDLLVGAVPLIGDVFDVFWRANLRNMRIVRRHLPSDAPVG